MTQLFAYRLPNRKTVNRAFAVVALVLIAASVSGCSKCGFIWDEGRGNACRSDSLPK
jgi:hypothetical protein